MSRFILTILLGAGLGGCTLEPIPSMELKCQMTKCVCTPSRAVFPVQPTREPVPVLWQDNGNAYCPEGHVLREATK